MGRTKRLYDGHNRRPQKVSMKKLGERRRRRRMARLLRREV